MEAYRQELRARLNPTVSVMSLAYEAARANPKRVLFAEGEEPNVLRAAIAFKEGGYGTPVLVGREEVHEMLKELGVDDPSEYEVLNSRNSPLVGRAVDHIYEKHQRHGLLRREIERMVNQDRNYFAAAMLSLGEADAMITGTTRPFSQSLKQVRTIIDDEPGATPFGINFVVSRSHTVLIADTAVTERPTAEQFAAIAMRSSGFARRMGLEPRVAFISYTTFGNPPGMHIEELRGAVKLLDGFNTDFEYEGEMAPDVALNYEMQKRYYPFSRLSGPANILVMPGLQSASLSAKLLRELGGESILGPYVLGLEHPVQIAPMTASASDLVMLAVLAGGDAHARQQRESAQGLDPLDRADRFGVAQGGDDRVQVGEVVDLDVEVEGMEVAVAVNQRQVDDVGVLGAERARHRPQRSGNVAQDHRETCGAAVRAFAPGEVEPVGIDPARQRVAADHMDLDALVLAAQADDPVAGDRVAAGRQMIGHARR